MGLIVIDLVSHYPAVGFPCSAAPPGIEYSTIAPGVLGAAGSEVGNKVGLAIRPGHAFSLPRMSRGAGVGFLIGPLTSAVISRFDRQAGICDRSSGVHIAQDR